MICMVASGVPPPAAARVLVVVCWAGEDGNDGKKEDQSLGLPDSMAPIVCDTLAQSRWTKKSWPSADVNLT